MEHLLGKWGIYPWFEEHGAHLVHPADLDAFRLALPSAMLFECTGSDGDYLKLRYRDRCYRVKPRLFEIVPKPSKVYGEVVNLMKGGKPVTGIIYGIGWHFKRKEPVFTVSVDGKRLKKRYFAADFIHGCARDLEEGSDGRS